MGGMERRTLLATMAGALAGCARRSEAVRVSVGPYLYLCPLYLALEAGYFADYGLTLELQQFAVSAQAIPLLAGGQVDVMFSAPSPALANAVAAGADVRIAAAQDYTAPACPGIGQLLVRRSAYPGGLPRVRDLGGRRVAVVNKAGLQEFCLDRMLAAEGMEIADVQMVVLRAPEALAALLSGQVDAMVTPDHFGKNPATISKDLVAIGGLTEVLPGFGYTYAIFGQRMFRGDVDLGGRFLAAHARGVSDFLDGRTPRFLEEFANKNNLDPNDARNLCRETAAKDGAVRLESLQVFLDWAHRKGYCPKPVKAETLVDGRFLEAAKRTKSGAG
jgi:NitT/TauT family transport system substrate-binding protein